LDVSKNNVLKELECEGNSFDCSALGKKHGINITHYNLEEHCGH
jgi:hypothetical protein